MVNRRERYEARFHALNLAKRGDYELYNGMVTRLEQALEAGDIEGGMDDSMRSTRERAHILLHQALATDTASKPKAASSSHSRQQAADWAKANAAAIEPRGSANNSNRSARSLRRSMQDDESETDLEINTTKALLQEAAARLTAGGTNLEAGINNVIYEKLMQELGLAPKVNANNKSPCISKSTGKAASSTERADPNSSASSEQGANMPLLCLPKLNQRRAQPHCHLHSHFLTLEPQSPG
jgi:hypothetical protein